MADTLLIIDMQNGVCHENNTSIENFESCVSMINTRIQVYRSQKKPIIFIQHQDEGLIPETIPWKIIPEFQLKTSDIIIQKTHANAFYQTDLEKVLTELNINSLEICGAQTEYCVDTTIKMAHGLGYTLQMYHGLTTTYDNAFMTAKQTIHFYESIWENRFVTFQTQ